MKKQEPVTKPCEFCGEPVTKTASQQRNRRYWSCGASCAANLRLREGRVPHSWGPNRFRGQKDTRPCIICGVPVTRYLSQSTEHVEWSCSRECAARYRLLKRIADGTFVRGVKPKRGVETSCPTCGKAVYRNRSQRKTNLNAYCSRECSYEGLKKGRMKACPICGKEFWAAPSTPQTYCSKPCETVGSIKRPLERIHNGRPAKKDKQGYILLWEPNHPNSAVRGWQYEHRLVAEQKYGRLLETYEHVHHLNGLKDDNRPENLEVMHGNDHARITGAEFQEDLKKLRQERLELEEYRRKFGPLTE